MVENLEQLKKHLKAESEFCRENANLSDTVECFADQKDYWHAKADAFEQVLNTISKADEFIKKMELKKAGLLERIKTKLGVVSS